MRILFLIACICLPTLTSLGQQSNTTVILVRHAEKAFDKSGDPDLTEEGRMRALELARILKDQRIDAIYSTPYKRTRQTIEPLSKQKDIKVEEYNPTNMDNVIKLIESSAGRVIVFSGHSNTVPVMLNKMMGEEKFKQLDETAYDNLFIASFKNVGNTEVLQLKFGKSSE